MFFNIVLPQLFVYLCISLYLLHFWLCLFVFVLNLSFAFNSSYQVIDFHSWVLICSIFFLFTQTVFELRPNKFKMIVFGDPQPYDLEQVDFFSENIVSENPTLVLSSPKSPKKLPIILNENEKLSGVQTKI